MKDDLPRPNLYLVGFMGTGKSSVARLLAHRLKLELIDSDQAIEASTGRMIKDIFATEGEAYFRELERDFVENGHPEAGCVVACGGGLIAQPGMPERLRARGLVASLFARPQTIFARTSRTNHRPLLQVADPLAEIEALLAIREPYYLAAGASFMTDFRPLHEVAAHIAAYYQRAAPTFRPGGREAATEASALAATARASAKAS